MKISHPGDVNFTSSSIIYHAAQVNRNALVAYGVDEASLMHQKASSDNHQAENISRFN